MFTWRKDPIYAASGGGSGVSNYNQLSNRPSINGRVLEGNMTAEVLGLQPAMEPITSEQIQDLNQEE